MKSPLTVTLDDIFAYAKANYGSTKYLNQRKKMTHRINAAKADHQTECARRLMEFVKAYLKDPQIDIFSMNANINQQQRMAGNASNPF